MKTTTLSPAAQAVFSVFNSKFDWVEDGVPGPQFKSIAAVLRAVADRVEPTFNPSNEWEKGFIDGVESVQNSLYAIATELEAQ
jgi:hypothetical protein